MKFTTLEINKLVKSACYITTICLPFLLSVSTAFSAENPTDSADMSFDDLLQELDQVTEIATRTKLNVDYVPGMVTVLQGEDLRKAGLFSFEDALKTVPGVEVSISNEGRSTLVMRGIGKTFASGKVKILVNGRATNTAMNAISTAAEIPMELVDRIEIIRGPGSAIYGEYAYAGVINIIMRKDSHVFYSGSQHNKHTIGGIVSNQKSESELKYALSFSAYQSEGKHVQTGGDYLKALNIGLPSNSPGYSNEAEKIITSGLQLSYKEIKWDTFVQHQQVGDFFGFRNALPPTVEPIGSATTATSNADMKFSVDEKLSGVISAGARYYALRGKEHIFLPAGFPDATTKTCPTCPPTAAFTDGVLGSPNYTEYEAHGSLEINYTGIKKHDILLGFSGTYIRQGDTWARRNYKFVGQAIGRAPLQNYRSSENWLSEGNVRKIASVYTQDQINIIEPLTVTIGGRFDEYFEIGQSFNPRVAAVYNLYDKHIFKFQYAQAFRPPTFLEMFAKNNIIAVGNNKIKPETINSVEIGYIFNNIRHKSTFRITTFMSDLEDLITNDETSGQYQNRDNVMSHGAEIEISKKFLRKIFINANATVLDVFDKKTKERLPNIANILGNLSASYKANSRYSITMSDQYTGKRRREKGDTRGVLAGYHIFNVALNIANTIIDQSTINIGIKNLFDQKIVNPSSLTKFQGNLIPSYANDYPRPGREIWLNVAYNY